MHGFEAVLKESKESEAKLQADLSAKDRYISELEGKLQEMKKENSTLSDQLVQTKNELERLRQKSKHAWHAILSL